jgi:hypothetical protein
LNMGCEMDVIGCSGTARAALAPFRRPQIAISAELGPLFWTIARSQSTPEPIRRSSGFHRIVSKSEQRRRTGSDQLYPNVAGSASRVVFSKMAPVLAQRLGPLRIDAHEGNWDCPGSASLP